MSIDRVDPNAADQEPVGFRKFEPNRSPGFWFVLPGPHGSYSLKRIILLRVDKGGAKGSSVSFVVVAWPAPVALFATGGVLLFSSARARRPAKPGLCARCGYNLSPTPALPACPECGAERATSPAPAGA